MRETISRLCGLSLLLGVLLFGMGHGALADDGDTSLLELLEDQLPQTDTLTGQRYDSVSIELRQFDPKKLETYHNDPDYLYDREPPKSMGLWAKFLQWLRSLFEDVDTPNTGFEFGAILWLLLEIFLWIVVIAGVVALILYYMGVNVRGIFTSSGEKATIDIGEVIENVRGVNYNELIHRAIEQGDYRLAVRLQYLNSLKILDEKELIEWARDKTNFDYYLELKSTLLKQQFVDITRWFDYIWYGNFPIEPEKYEKAEAQFQAFNNELKRY